MKQASAIHIRPKLLSTIILGFVLLTSLLPSVGFVMAATPPTIPGQEDYMSDYGLLHTDTYLLYPWEQKSLDIGFSKYGELINLEDELGLRYDGVDVFANPNVPMEEWSSGWLLNIHYTDQSILKNVWTYALTTDWSNEDGIGGPWRQMQSSVDASAPGDTNGGRRTSGWAESDDIRLIYDGPRKAIYLLRTTIYDKNPDNPEPNEGTPLVELVIQLVFNKVKKYVLEIKDIKRIDNNKMTGPFQIEFSQRGEWDLGELTRSLSYAEFYDGLRTKYVKHPFYYPEGTHNVTYDLVQVIDEEMEKVGFAAFWPQTISKWVTDVEHTTREEVLTSMETFRYSFTLPESEDDLPDWIEYPSPGTWKFRLPYDAIEYPRGCGVWDSRPWVFVTEPEGPTKLSDTKWEWDDTPPQHVTVHWPDVEWGDTIDIVYKREMKGFAEHEEITPMACMPDDMFVPDAWDGPSYGMECEIYNETGVPYVRAEWDFDLDYNNPECSTHQFRCVSLYGLTDYHNAVDPDMDDLGLYLIDEEVIYQLYEVFNPWDLSDAAHKTTFRWAQKGSLISTIVLDSHLHDKYSNDRDCLDCYHEMIVPEKWGYYCEDSEKVILLDSSGTNEPLLLSRTEDYDVTSPFTITLDCSTEGYDYYKVLYSTMKTTEEPHWYHTGRWEWTVIGEESLASDSIGAGMIGSTFTDWKNKEMWLSGLDVQAEVYGPRIPYLMERFNDSLPGRQDFQFDYGAGDYRTAFMDDWCTPEDYAGDSTIYPYAISSSNIIVVGGPIVNVAAEYFNDFTDALVFTEYGGGFYAPGCWARTTQPSPDMSEEVDELWYNSTTVDDDVGYALIATYKDLNETVGYVVYGYTAEDTYYACYALRGGLLPWTQMIQNGTTAIILEIDYSDLHPVQFHVKEALGPFTECTGANTNFKTGDYDANMVDWYDAVVSEADHLGLCYKLVDIEWCAQIHPDP